uniref:Uncharacterized protein n=1 Tax=Timema shepardi TaxID=629360 RepID=A0A7R9AR90_TIMSH|nr:unnamed protein product [Timema shepardi]
MTSPHPGTPGSTVGAPPNSYPGLTPTSDTDGPIKIERLSGGSAKKRKESPGSAETKPSSSELGNSQSSTGGNTTAPANSTSGQKGSKRSRRYAEEDNEDPGTKAVREKERRQANNVRESADDEEDPDMKVAKEKERRQANNARERAPPCLTTRRNRSSRGSHSRFLGSAPGETSSRELNGLPSLESPAGGRTPFSLLFRVGNSSNNSETCYGQYLKRNVGGGFSQ